MSITVSPLPIQSLISLLLPNNPKLGNGTQRAFYDDDSILYISLHRYDNAVFYPGGPEGNLDWVGEGKGEGKNVNIPWNGIMGDSDYVVAFDRVVMPILREFAPEIIFGSSLFSFEIAPTI